ncbi:MAG: cobalamin-dependent protein [Proteobacteria bacterium]|nr:cobalamin-dependent protein [Pseudomonadota bacterium]
MQNLNAIQAALANLEEDLALQLVAEAMAAGVSALELLKACQAGMVEVGARFEQQEYFVSDLMMSGEIFKQISAILEPGLKAGGAVSAGKVVIGTVKGDIHDIGKDIVVNMLKSANIDVIDLGVDVAPAKFIDALKNSGATVLGLSGLLTLAFDSMKATISALAEAGMRDTVKVMIGGGPVDATVCRVVGADDWGADAQHAVRIAKGWLEAAHV